jgi:hypothetical protein
MLQLLHYKPIHCLVCQFYRSQNVSEKFDTATQHDVFGTATQHDVFGTAHCNITNEHMTAGGNKVEVQKQAVEVSDN